MTLYVSNLSYVLNDYDLKKLFEQFGTVDRVTVVVDHGTGRSRGFGFVDMPSNTEAESAMRELNGMLISGRALRVQQAHPRKAGSPSWPT